MWLWRTCSMYRFTNVNCLYCVQVNLFCFFLCEFCWLLHLDTRFQVDNTSFTEFWIYYKFKIFQLRNFFLFLRNADHNHYLRLLLRAIPCRFIGNKDKLHSGLLLSCVHAFFNVGNTFKRYLYRVFYSFKYSNE